MHREEPGGVHRFPVRRSTISIGPLAEGLFGPAQTLAYVPLHIPEPSKRRRQAHRSVSVMLGYEEAESGTQALLVSAQLLQGIVAPRTVQLRLCPLGAG